MMTASIAIHVLLLTGCLTSTPALKGVAGTASVARTEFIEIKGIKQHVSIRGRDTDKPILLVLHGGPGTAVMPLSRIRNARLEEHFIVVNWDQPGAGNTRIPEYFYKTMTMDDFVDTAYYLILHLCREFEKEKVYVMGHSWGSLVGINLAKKYPAFVEKFISIGQLVDVTRSEPHAYDYLLTHVTDPEELEEVKRIGPPVDGWYKDGYDSFYRNRALLLKYGGVLYGQNSFKPFIRDMLLAPECGIFGIGNWLGGSKRSLTWLWPRLVTEADLFRDVPSLEVPVVFIVGRHDHNAWFSLTEEYYNFLQADKKIYWFENSGHAPNYEESELFMDIVIGESQ
jgi:pimeloyl-ACP methyl ester carboxylesterase